MDSAVEFSTAVNSNDLHEEKINTCLCAVRSMLVLQYTLVVHTELLHCSDCG